MSPLRIAAVVCCSLGLALSGPGAQRENGQRLPVATTVTLTAKDKPLSQVLAEVAEKNGISVESQFGEPEPKVNVELNRKPFWEALDMIAESAGAHVTILARGGRIVLSKRVADQRPPIVSTSGPFRFCVKGVTAGWDFDTGVRTYLADVEVAWEPGLQPLFLETYPQDVVAIDNKGGRHPVPDAGRSKAGVDGRISLSIKVPLPSLPRATASLAQLDGRLEAIAPSKMVRFAFPKLEKGTALKQDGVTCKITDMILKDYRWSVQVSIENPGGGTELESYQPWDSNNALTLVSKDGKTRLAANSYVRESQSTRRAVLGYHFIDRAKLAGSKPEEWSLVYTTPALVVTVPLTFSFKDVPLP